ncbi:type II and III secretion system protein family protein [Iodidimonas sp. SYSU 1G8]|uniref:type II and III secretion system protein family protein n=1 Tax=Iodidimonas sp. SYSU 1G8 TaxID=3133967 RepID=UPI0031FEC88A
MIFVRAKAPTARRFAGQLRSMLVMACAVAVLAYGAVPARAISPGETMVNVDVHKGTVLHLTQPAATVFVADPSIADVESRSQKAVFVYGKKSGETSLFVLDADDKPLVNVTIKVGHDLSRLEKLIDAIAPDAEITLSSVDGGMVISGVTESAQEAEEIQRVAERFLGDKETVLNRISVTAPTQVNLRIRFAEISKEVLRIVGVSWRAQDLTGDTQFNIIASPPQTSAGAESNFATIGQRFGPATLQATIEALEKEGLVSLLAEPNLTAISGETASFLAGGEFPVPIGIDDNTIGIEFKPYGVSLSFTPTVLSGNRISLRLRPEVSQLSDTGAIILQDFQIPGLTTRRAETTIELASGQSFIIAGLMQNRTANDINKVPALGDIPILGKLFQSKRYQSAETELVIIATPYLVRPIGAGKKPTLPTDRPVSDRQFEKLLIGQMKRPVAETNPVATGQIAGPVGFMVE